MKPIRGTIAEYPSRPIEPDAATRLRNVRVLADRYSQIGVCVPLNVLYAVLEGKIDGEGVNL